MKIRKDHYSFLLAHMAEALRQNSKMKAEYAEAKFSDKRYRWDLLWKCKLSSWISVHLYSYLNDDHIDTALKAILKELEHDKETRGT